MLSADESEITRLDRPALPAHFAEKSADASPLVEALRMAGIKKNLIFV
jgi:hypothetical protein